MAIIGAGPGGLATALALQRQGYDVRVFEQRETFRPAGVAVFIWPHGLSHLKTIDALTCERVIAAGAEIRTIAIERLDPGKSGIPETLLTINVKGWSDRMNLPPQIGITWARLTEALRAGLLPETIRLGHALEDIYENPSSAGSDCAEHDTDGVTLTFAPTRSGAPTPSPVRARVCVVGADGRNSRVREAVFGAGEESVFGTAKPSASTAAATANVYYALSPNPSRGVEGNGMRACAHELRFSLCDGSGISLLDVGRGNLDLDSEARDCSVSVSVSSTPPSERAGQLMFGTTRFAEPALDFQTPERRLDHLKALFKETTPLIRAVLEGATADQVVQTTLYERSGPAAKAWSKGRVVLLGDAAHCMYPSLGLGISTAFADAVELSARLGACPRASTTRTEVSGETRLRETRLRQRAVRRALEAYSKNRGPPARILQTASRVMHAALAATAEKPTRDSKSPNAFVRFDPSAAFFKLWRSVLWAFGDR